MGLLAWLLPPESREASQTRLTKAQALMGRREYSRAIALLKRRRFHTATKAEACAALAEALFHSGSNPLTARIAAQQAVNLANLPETLEAAAGNLYEINRYIGEVAGAAEMADLLSTLRSKAGDDAGARRYARQAAMVRGGEPLLRVVGSVGDQRYEIEELLEGVAGPVRFFFERNRPTPWRASESIHLAEEAAMAGKFPVALEHLSRDLREGVEPSAWYLAAVIAGHQGDWTTADRALGQVQKLAPGWFHARSAQDVARSEDAALFRSWHALAEGPLSPMQKGGLAEQALRTWRLCAHLHHLHGKALKALNQQAAAENAFRRALEHAAEDSLVTRVCVDLAAVTPSATEKERLLRRAVELGADLPAAATARIVLAFPEGERSERGT